MDIFFLNALGDVLISLSALYAAYVVRRHKALSGYLVSIATTALVSAVVFLRGFTGIDFFIFSMVIWIVFSIMFVEATSHMIEGFNMLRGSFVLYLFVFAFTPSDIFTVSVISIGIAYMIVLSCFVSLLVLKKGNARLYSAIGFFGVALPLLIGAGDMGFALAPWKFPMLAFKIPLAIFFAGFALSTRKEPQCFFGYKRDRRKKK